MMLRICQSRLDGLCPGHNLTHCQVHEHESGCHAGWCDGVRVGECVIYSGEVFAEIEPEMRGECHE